MLHFSRRHVVSPTTHFPEEILLCPRIGYGHQHSLRPGSHRTRIWSFDLVIIVSTKLHTTNFLNCCRNVYNRRPRGRFLGPYIYNTGRCCKLTQLAQPTPSSDTFRQGCSPPPSSMPVVPQTRAIPVRTLLLPHSGAWKHSH